jgi:plasmid stability protein
MATLTIRNLDERTKTQLRIQAARHGRSMEEEARTILRSAIEEWKPAANGKGLGSRIHDHFAQLGGVELDLPERSSLPTPAQFDRDAELEP